MKAGPLNLGIIGSGNSSQKLLRLLAEQGLAIRYALASKDISEEHICANDIDIWLLDLQDSDWNDALDALMDRSPVPIFFNEYGAVDSQQHTDYWCRNLITRMQELAVESDESGESVTASAASAKTSTLPAEELKTAETLHIAFPVIPALRSLATLVPIETTDPVPVLPAETITPPKQDSQVTDLEAFLPSVQPIVDRSLLEEIVQLEHLLQEEPDKLFHDFGELISDDLVMTGDSAENLPYLKKRRYSTPDEPQTAFFLPQDMAETSSPAPVSVQAAVNAAVAAAEPPEPLVSLVKAAQSSTNLASSKTETERSDSSVATAPVAEVLEQTQIALAAVKHLLAPDDEVKGTTAAVVATLAETLEPAAMLADETGAATGAIVADTSLATSLPAVDVILDAGPVTAEADGSAVPTVTAEITALPLIAEPEQLADEADLPPLLEAVASSMEFEDVVDVAEVRRTPLNCDLWVLASSLGGPAALKRFFAAIVEPIPVCFLVAQHIDAHFVTVLGKILEQTNSFYQVHVLSRPGLVEPGTTLLTPVEKRLSFLDAGQIVQSMTNWTPPYKPCIDDVLLDAVAAYPGQVNTIIFSGMGEDGVNGVKRVAETGGLVWAQDVDSCASSVMPDGAAKTGKVQWRANPEQLAQRMILHYRHRAAVQDKR